MKHFGSDKLFSVAEKAAEDVAKYSALVANEEALYQKGLLVAASLDQGSEAQVEAVKSATAHKAAAKNYERVLRLAKGKVEAHLKLAEERQLEEMLMVKKETFLN